MVFGRCFEKALTAYFCREDPTAVLFHEWGSYRDVPLEYGKGEIQDKQLWNLRKQASFIDYRTFRHIGR